MAPLVSLHVYAWLGSLSGGALPRLLLLLARKGMGTSDWWQARRGWYVFARQVSPGRGEPHTARTGK